MDISRSWTTAQHLPRQDCDLVTVPARQGLEAVDILRRACDGLGPVLHDDAGETLGFVVPPGTADGWDLPGSACTQTSGRGIRISFGAGDLQAQGPPGAAAGEPPGAEASAAGPPGTGPPAAESPGADWLVPPDAAYTVATDPVELRAALGEAARTIEAVDRCQ